MKRHIPNIITCLNALSGCLAVVYAFGGDYRLSACLIALAAVFDFFDGFCARLLKVVSPIGKELDSLSDVISFGVAPSAILFRYLQENAAAGFLPAGICTYLSYLAFLMVAFSAVRLAHFNLDNRQSTSFLGLPTPANAFFWAFGILFLEERFQEGIEPLFLIGLLLVCCWLLVSEIPMFSLKFKNLKWKDNALRYIFLLGCLVLLAIFHLGGLALCILWYLLLCLVFSRQS